MTAFATRAQAIVDDILKHEPIRATLAGIHDYDAEMPDVSAAGYADRRSRAKRHLDAVAEVPPESLSASERIDAELLRSHFEVALRELDELELFTRDPSMYPDLAVEGLYSLLIRPHASRSDQLTALRSRLEQIPAVLASGKTNVERPPALWIDVAADVTRGSLDFLNQAVAPLAAERSDWTSPLERARAAFDDYASFLHALRARSDGAGFAIGRELFDYKLKREHFLRSDADSLLAFGETMVRETQDTLERVARSIDPNLTWVELVERLREDHPEPSQLLSEYRRSMENVKRFIGERRLASIPGGERLDIVETPVFMRPLLPYAAYQAAGAFQEQQDGLYYVTPIDSQASTESQRDQLRGHNRCGMLLTNVHEGYPGHHLQLVRANRHPSTVRRLLGDSSVFCEGWALYCEQMILDEGLNDDPRVRLFQLKDQLWRACRVVVDVKLHARQLSFDAAVDYMVDVAHLERYNAIGEVRRYTQSATQPMSYLVGKQQIMDFRGREQQRLGAGFELRAFHDRLLSFGSIPLALVEPNFSLEVSD